MPEDLLYRSFRVGLFDGSIDLLHDRLRVMLVREYKPDPEHTIRDVRPFETAGNGYEQGGMHLTGRRLTWDGSDMTFHADNVVWGWGGGVSISATGAVIYRDSDRPEDVALVAYRHFGGVKLSVDAPFAIEFKGGVLSMGNCDSPTFQEVNDAGE